MSVAKSRGLWYPYVVAPRVALVLDDTAREAARQLARRHGCALAEAVHRALVQQRDAGVAVPAGRRMGRTEALRRLFHLFEGNDAAAEIRRLRAENRGF